MKNQYQKTVAKTMKKKKEQKAFHGRVRKTPSTTSIFRMLDCDGEQESENESESDCKIDDDDIIAFFDQRTKTTKALIARAHDSRHTKTKK